MISSSPKPTVVAVQRRSISVLHCDQLLQLQRFSLLFFERRSELEYLCDSVSLSASVCSL